MMDEYQYKTLELPAKNQGLFGIGGMPNSEGIGFTGRVIDSSGGFAGGVGGAGGQDGIQGGEGPEGYPGILFPGAQKGDMLYRYISNVEGWGLLRAPLGGEGGIFYVNNRVPTWITASHMQILSGNGQSNWDFSRLSPPPNNGKEYALGQIGGNLKWIEITSCPT